MLLIAGSRHYERNHPSLKPSASAASSLVFEAKYNGEIIGSTLTPANEAQAELDRIAYELAKVAA